MEVAIVEQPTEPVTSQQLTHHCPFVGRLRGMFFEDPEGAIDLLGVLGRESLVQEWDIVGMRWHENYPNPLIVPPDGLALSTHDLGSGLTATVITLPRPDLADSLFVGMVVPPPGVMLRVFDGPPSNEPRFFTLEDSGAARPFFCEWPRERERHCNFGTVPEPTIEAFLEKLGSLVIDQGRHVSADG